MDGSLNSYSLSFFRKIGQTNVFLQMVHKWCGGITLHSVQRVELLVLLGNADDLRVNILVPVVVTFHVKSEVLRAKIKNLKVYHTKKHTTQ